MTATNHALTGAIIGLSIHQPVLAISLAFISHFALDSIPHMGGLFKVGSKTFKKYLVVEAILCFLIVLALFIAHPTDWWLAAICAFTATTPDFMWVNEYVAAARHRKKPVLKHWLAKLHRDIQWFQKPSGAIVEIAWAAACLMILAILIKT